MKKLFFGLPLLVLLSCSQPDAHQSEAKIKDTTDKLSADALVRSAIKSQDKLQAVIDSNVNQKPAIDTVFLNFVFGMTKAQFDAHFKKVKVEKKFVVVKENSRWEYPMSFSYTTPTAALAPDYYNGKMYELALIITPSKMDVSDNSNLTYTSVALAYHEKYENFNRFDEDDILYPGNKQHHWIKNNLHIFLRRTSEGIILTYTDLRVQKKIDKKEAAASDSLNTQTRKDI